MAADLQRINNTFGKMAYYLGNHQTICVGVSGGSDSNIIVHMIATNFREYLPKIHFVFENTGLEYRATLKHLEYMEERYNINIERIRGESVVTVVKREGVPVVSKDFSTVVHYAQLGKEWAIKKLELTRKDALRVFPEKQRDLANFLINSNIKVSSECCNKSKKKPYKKYLKEVKADLQITGERRSEGGVRAVVHKNCFESRANSIDKYMPLFFWDDETKEYYKEKEGIKYSDCYEVWGMKRTGYVGCPFDSRIANDLELTKKYEPNLYNACIHVFGESYKVMDQFRIHKDKVFQTQKYKKGKLMSSYMPKRK